MDQKGYLACARCSATGVCLNLKPISLSSSSSDLSLQVKTTERCPNCSGAGKVRVLYIRKQLIDGKVYWLGQMELYDVIYITHSKASIASISVCLWERKCPVVCLLAVLHGHTNWVSLLHVLISHCCVHLGNVPDVPVHRNGDGKWAWPADWSIWLRITPYTWVI